MKFLYCLKKVGFTELDIDIVFELVGGCELGEILAPLGRGEARRQNFPHSQQIFALGRSETFGEEAKGTNFEWGIF